MTEIQRLLTETIESLNTREKRDNKPRFSISFIRKHPGLFIGMYVAFFATLAVMLQSETLSGSVWLLVVLFILLNGFFFFDVYPRYRYEDSDVLDFRVCYNGEWYNTRFVPAALVEAILNSPRVADVHKEQLQKMIVRKGELSFYDIFTLARAESTSYVRVTYQAYSSAPGQMTMIVSTHHFMKYQLYLLISCQPFSTIRYTFPTLC